MAFTGGYHGTGERFADAWDTVIRLPYNDIPAVRAAVDSTVGAVFAEPFLGSGGVVIRAGAELSRRVRGDECGVDPDGAGPRRATWGA